MNDVDVLARCVMGGFSGELTKLAWAPAGAWRGGKAVLQRGVSNRRAGGWTTRTGRGKGERWYGSYRNPEVKPMPVPERGPAGRGGLGRGSKDIENPAGLKRRQLSDHSRWFKDERHGAGWPSGVRLGRGRSAAGAKPRDVRVLKKKIRQNPTPRVQAR